MGKSGVKSVVGLTSSEWEMCGIGWITHSFKEQKQEHCDFCIICDHEQSFEVHSVLRHMFKSQFTWLFLTLWSGYVSANALL